VLSQAFEICALTKTDPTWDSKRNSHLCKIECLSFILIRFISNLYLKYENASVHLAVFDPEIFEVTTSYFETYNDCSELINVNDVCTLDSRVFNIHKF